MQIIRELSIGGLRFRVIFESRDIEAHSLLSGLQDDEMERIQNAITKTTVGAYEVLEGAYPSWKLEHPS